MPSVSKWSYTGNKLHPTQKPVEALKEVIETYSRKGDIVLDPFMGSGSTALAAKLTARDYIGYELEKAYHSAAVKRLKAAFVKK